MDLTDTFSKFRKTSVTTNQKINIIATILMDKWYYMYGTPA